MPSARSGNLKVRDLEMVFFLCILWLPETRIIEKNEYFSLTCVALGSSRCLGARFGINLLGKISVSPVIWTATVHGNPNGCKAFCRVNTKTT